MRKTNFNNKIIPFLLLRIRIRTLKSDPDPVKSHPDPDPVKSRPDPQHWSQVIIRNVNTGGRFPTS